MTVKAMAGRRIGLSALAYALLVACSPKYDWRTVHSNEGAYTVDYPAKLTAEVRPIAISGQRMPAMIQAASVDDTLFTIDVVELLTDDPVWRQHVVETLRNSLSASLKGHVTECDIVVQTATQPPLSLPVLELIVLGADGDDPTPRRLTARVVTTGKHAYQAVMLGSDDAARDARQQEQVSQFLVSFHPY